MSPLLCEEFLWKEEKATIDASFVQLWVRINRTFWKQGVRVSALPLFLVPLHASHCSESWWDISLQYRGRFLSMREATLIRDVKSSKPRGICIEKNHCKMAPEATGTDPTEDSILRASRHIAMKKGSQKAPDQSPERNTFQLWNVLRIHVDRAGMRSESFPVRLPFFFSCSLMTFLGWGKQMPKVSVF